MDVLSGLMHRWRWNGEPYIPFCPSVGRNLGGLSAGDLPQEDFWGSSRLASRDARMQSSSSLRVNSGLSVIRLQDVSVQDFIPQLSVEALAAAGSSRNRFSLISPGTKVASHVTGTRSPRQGKMSV